MSKKKSKKRLLNNLLKASIILLVVCFICFYPKKSFIFVSKEFRALKSLGYTNKEIKTITDNFSEEDVNKYLMENKYDNLFVYKDSTGFNIEHLDRYKKFDNGKYDTSKVVLYVEIGLDNDFYTNITTIKEVNETTLVNKYYKLVDNYSSSNVVKLSTEYSRSSQKVSNNIKSPLIKMFDDAKKAGYSLNVVSGYRTHSLQNTLFTNSTKRNGLSHALKYSAKAGHSEHQTGYAIDINSTQDSFANTKEYTWLINNSYKYGFIERYPKGKEFITGYGYEPWHYRYVGIDIATKIHEENITFEEYKILFN